MDWLAYDSNDDERGIRSPSRVGGIGDQSSVVVYPCHFHLLNTLIQPWQWTRIIQLAVVLIEMRE